jgi:PAS domain S-box-containing protein
MTDRDPSDSGDIDGRAADKNALWQLSSDLMLRCTFAGEITAVNPAWTRVLGWTEGELIGSSLFDLVHPDDLQVTQDGTRIYSDDGSYRRFDNRYQSSDGRYHWISWSTSIGENLINAVGRDVTTEKQQAEALKESLDFTRLALTAVGGVGVWTYDVASNLYRCDEAIAGLFGLDPEEARNGVTPDQFLRNLHPADRARVDAVRQASLASPEDFAVEYRIVHPNGATRWVLARGHTFHEHGQPMRRTGVAVETTVQRQLEEQLRQSQKMEAVGQLTGGIAHDFNNLLTGITGSLELIRTRMEQGRQEEAGRYITAAENSARRAAALTHRLLAFSRRQTLDPRVTDANRLIAEMAEMLGRTVGPGVVVEVAAAEALWKTQIDPNQLENAVLNLCINARDAMPRGGEIVIETRNVALDAREAAARQLAPGEYVSIAVRDEGTGMPPEVAARAFDPFFTTKPLGQGTGLGLSMIYGFARQSGGMAQIDSAPGQGTKVTLYLPRYTGTDEQVGEPAGADETASPAQGETVMIVDDEPIIRMLLVDVLEEQGYRVLQASDAAEGLEILNSDAPIGLLVTDVGLPGEMNGRQMADAARIIRPDLKILFVTGFAETALAGQNFLEPGMHVITKPFEFGDLTRKISELIAGEG